MKLGEELVSPIMCGPAFLDALKVFSAAAVCRQVSPLPRRKQQPQEIRGRVRQRGSGQTLAQTIQVAADSVELEARQAAVDSRECVFP
jgi:hypothetical protein